ncbi:hypothetical protein PG997_001894 [Apiospora hydei]|uniref:Uncharacterized protein n=1 Tax=Apiospora hydei TaxID=1337664 RepID=A0ABR1X832_9PEZI
MSTSLDDDGGGVDKIQGDNTEGPNFADKDRGEQIAIGDRRLLTPIHQTRKLQQLRKPPCPSNIARHHYIIPTGSSLTRWESKSRLSPDEAEPRGDFCIEGSETAKNDEYESPLGFGRAFDDPPTILGRQIQIPDTTTMFWKQLGLGQHNRPSVLTIPSNSKTKQRVSRPLDPRYVPPVQQNTTPKLPDTVLTTRPSESLQRIRLAFHLDQDNVDALRGKGPAVRDSWQESLHWEDHNNVTVENLVGAEEKFQEQTNKDLVYNDTTPADL